MEGKPTKKDVYIKARKNPQWESEFLSKRPLRGPQAEIVNRIEAFLQKREGGVMTCRFSRQSGKNEIAAVVQRRHLWRNQQANLQEIWIRTAPTYIPQIVNSKKRLKELLKINSKWRILHPIFEKQRMQRSEGYIWSVRNASIEFLSSGPQSNVVGATASYCLDMDEAHKIDKDKFDEDFGPFTANTNAGTLMWGVAANNMDCLQWYVDYNEENNRPDLNLFYPCDVWMEVNPAYKAHVEGRVAALGWDHPVIMTQYRLIPISAQGTFVNTKQARSFFSGSHIRRKVPQDGVKYHLVVDIAAGNEDFDPLDMSAMEKDNAGTDSTVIWVYEVTPIIASNNLFPIIKVIDCEIYTGQPLEDSEGCIDDAIDHWNPDKVTIDSIGVGRQIGESMVAKWGEFTVNAYTASNTSVSEDCYDFLARLNHESVLMWGDDDSPEYKAIQNQINWTMYSADKGKMKLIKPKATMHIDAIKALTYIHQNAPVAGITEMFKMGESYQGFNR